MRMQYLAATIIAVLVFFVLNIMGSITIRNDALPGALINAFWKSAVFGMIFHVIHNVVANLFKIYEKDKSE